METDTYNNYPKTIITWSNKNTSFVTIDYYGISAVGGTSGPQTGNSWTTPDLSFGEIYTFIMTKYDNLNNATINQFTIDTTPSNSGNHSTVSTTSSSQIQWYGNYSYVRIYRKITYPYVTDYTEVSSNILPPFIDLDLSGNTTYVYYIEPYDVNNKPYSSSNEVSITTLARGVKNISVVYDSSAVEVAFSAPRNSYTTSAYYQLNTSSRGVTTSVSGESAPLLIAGLSGNTTYSYNVAVYLDGELRATSQAGATITTAAQSAADLSAVFYDNSAIEVAFTLPRNSYTSSYYYQLNTTAGGVTTTASGESAPILVDGLSGNTTYSYNVDVYLDGALRTTTEGATSVLTAAQSAADLSATFYDSSAIQVAFTLPRNSYTSSYYYQLNTTAGDVTISASGQTAPLLVAGLSGNTTYSYNVDVYLDGALRTTTEGSNTVLTAAQAAENLNAAFYDSSAIQVDFTLPHNSYTSSYYYQLNTTAGGVTTSASGQSAPILVEGLSGNTTYTYSIDVYLDGTLRTTAEGSTTVTTQAQSVADVNAAFYDSSAIQVAFTLPRNSYTSSYYQLNTIAGGVTISASGQSAPLLVAGLSGNTTYSYNVDVYLDGALRTTTQGTTSVLTAAQSAADLNTTFYDSSAIQVAFTLPRNSYTSSYYYQVNTTADGIMTSASGQSAPILVAGLSGNTTYSYNVDVYLDGALRTTTQSDTTVTTPVQYAMNLSPAFYDNSAIEVTFTLPRNSYTSSYYYQLNTTYAGITSSASGQTAPLLVADLSGNTSYTYTIDVYLDDALSATTSGATPVTTLVQSASNLTAAFYDSSAIQVTFTMPRNSYTSSYYYQLNTIYAGITSSASGQTTPLLVADLSGNTSYTYTIDVYLDDALSATTSGATPVTTLVQSASNLTAAFYDSSAIEVTFTLPRNSYTSSYYYQLNTTTEGVTSSVSGQIAPLLVADLSGNTTYTYTIDVYLDDVLGATTSGATPVTTPAQAAYDLSAIFYDSSALQVTFTLPRNKYTYSYYYQLNAVSNGVTTSVSGLTSPLLVKGLTGDTSYNYYISTYLDGVNKQNSLSYNFTTLSINLTVIVPVLASIVPIGNTSVNVIISNYDSQYTYTITTDSSYNKIITTTATGATTVITGIPTNTYNTVTAVSTKSGVTSGNSNTLSFYNSINTATTYVTFTSNTQDISGITTTPYQYLNGIYDFSLSSVPNNPPYLLNNINNTSVVGGVSTYDGVSGLYKGSVSTYVSGIGTVSGEWFQYKLPYSLYVTSYYYYFNGANPSRIPTIWVLAGSNDGTNWYYIDNSSGSGNISLTTYVSTIPTTAYSYLRYIVKQIVGGGTGLLSTRLTMLQYTGTIAN